MIILNDPTSKIKQVVNIPLWLFLRLWGSSPPIYNDPCSMNFVMLKLTLKATSSRSSTTNAISWDWCLDVCTSCSSLISLNNNVHLLESCTLKLSMLHHLVHFLQYSEHSLQAWFDVVACLLNRPIVNQVDGGRIIWSICIWKDLV